MAASFHLDPSKVYRASVLEEIPWLEHGFGTRLSKSWTHDTNLTTVRQIHSARVLIANGNDGVIGEGDALVSDRGGTLVAIRTADCLPILIADQRKMVVAAVHAGWRGTAARIAANTIATMADTFGSVPEDLVVVIGPGIGECCFEVGPEVAECFQRLFPERADLGGRAKINLAEANRRQLCQAGVGDGQIHLFDLCTCCHRDVFESYRRDREASGRMVTAIGIRS